MSEHQEDKRTRLQRQRNSEVLSDALAALDEMEATNLDLSQLPAEVSFSTYFGATELEELRALARPRGENVAGMLALFWPRVEATLRAMSEDELTDAHQQSKPLQKVGLKLPGFLLFNARLLAWRFDCSPAAILHVTHAVGRRLLEFAPEEM